MLLSIHSSQFVGEGVVLVYSIDLLQSDVGTWEGARTHG